jgi:uncharacterized surface protein with fasciclin (FAS1) repeats
MKFSKLLVAAALAVTASAATIVALAPAMPAVAGDYGTKKAKGDLIAVATDPAMTDVTTLVAAIKAAGLVETLQGTGPFTVFAPTNEAFAKLPPGTVENLLKPENKEALKAILLYHVHAGAAVQAKDVKTMSLSTANGKPLNIVVKDGTVTVNDAKVIKTDVTASNGIIHLVDTVILPPK